RDQERVRNAARRIEEAALADPVFGAVDVHQDLAFDDVDQLVLARVEMHRRRLAAHDPILEQHERAARLRSGRLHREHATAGKPPLLPLPLVPDQCLMLGHRILLSPVYGTIVPLWVLRYHMKRSAGLARRAARGPRWSRRRAVSWRRA